MAKKTYSEKLRDPRWQKRRLEIFQRDEFKCTKCQCSEDTLHVHHLRYQSGSDPWESPDSDLETLCEYCHAIAEGLREMGYELASVVRETNNENTRLLFYGAAANMAKNRPTCFIYEYERDKGDWGATLLLGPDIVKSMFELAKTLHKSLNKPR
jgi:glutaredoxin